MVRVVTPTRSATSPIRNACSSTCPICVNRRPLSGRCESDVPLRVRRAVPVQEFAKCAGLFASQIDGRRTSLCDGEQGSPREPRGQDEEALRSFGGGVGGTQVSEVRTRRRPGGEAECLDSD